MAKDPCGITYQQNITASVEGGFVLGVHEGVNSKVKVAFLHNADIFPFPYADVGPVETMRSMAVFAKGCLEYCCKKGIIPSVCITNDWFTGLIPAYAKERFFGDTFNGTTFFHIVHNLEPTYEGRLYPPHHMGALESIHGLPRHFVCDP